MYTYAQFANSTSLSVVMEMTKYLNELEKRLGEEIEIIDINTESKKTMDGRSWFVTTVMFKIPGANYEEEEKEYEM